MKHASLQLVSHNVNVIQSFSKMTQPRHEGTADDRIAFVVFDAWRAATAAARRHRTATVGMQLEEGPRSEASVGCDLLYHLATYPQYQQG